MRFFAKFLVLACAIVASSHTLAASCSVSMVTNINFTYDPSALDLSVASGTLGVSCNGLIGEAITYNLLMSKGRGDFSQRKLAGSHDNLQYNLFKEIAHLNVWGDGTSGFMGLTDAYVLSARTQIKDYGIYLLAPPLQAISAGSYSDTLMVTVQY